MVLLRSTSSLVLRIGIERWGGALYNGGVKAGPRFLSLLHSREADEGSTLKCKFRSQNANFLNVATDRECLSHVLLGDTQRQMLHIEVIALRRLRPLRSIL